MKSLGLLDGYSQVDEHRDVGVGGRRVGKGSWELSLLGSGLSSGILDSYPRSKVTQ